MKTPWYADKCLVVEDSPPDAELITEYLTVAGWPEEMIVKAARLSEAETLLKQGDVGAILLDLRLPDGQGVPCVEALRLLDPSVPIVVLTGYDDDDMALACLGAGAQDYLSKQELGVQVLRRTLSYAIVRIREALARGRADALQARLAAIVESSSDAILSTTPAGVITSWNRGAMAIFGHTPEEALGRPIGRIVRAADDPDGERQSTRIADFAAGLASGEPTELIRLHKNGTPMTVSMVGSALRDAEGKLVAYAAICRDVTEARRRDQELQERNAELLRRDQQMRALAERLNAAREEERTRISREVHDELGQLLTGLKMDLRWLERRLVPASAPPVESLRAKLRGAQEAVDATIESVQRIALELRPSALDTLGLAAALRDEARRFETRSGIPVRCEVRGEVRVEEVASTAFFRILQELLTNVLRHAQATQVSVEFDAGESEYQLQVRDDGVGLVPGRERAHSLGVLGMRERAEALGGSFRLEGSGGSGTLAEVKIPRVKIGGSGC